jgi:hypothetical protein
MPPRARGVVPRPEQTDHFITRIIQERRRLVVVAGWAGEADEVVGARRVGESNGDAPAAQRQDVKKATHRQGARRAEWRGRREGSVWV